MQLKRNDQVSLTCSWEIASGADLRTVSLLGYEVGIRFKPAHPAAFEPEANFDLDASVMPDKSNHVEQSKYWPPSWPVRVVRPGKKLQLRVEFIAEPRHEGRYTCSVGTLVYKSQEASLDLRVAGECFLLLCE